MSNENKIIRSALEIALEKVKNTKVPEDELEKDSFVELGKKIAVQYMRKEIDDFQKPVDSAGKNKEAIRAGIEQVLLMNIILPRTDKDMKENRVAMEGMVKLKQNKKQALQICNAIEENLKNYQEQKNEIHAQLKERFLVQIEKASQSQETQALRGNIEVENIPEFQKQLRNIYMQLDEEYGKVVGEFKEKLKSTS